MRRPWRVALGLILVAAIVLRGLFFVGFGLVDDPCYLYCVSDILAGSYPPLDPLNQYAYRPLLLYLFGGSIALFGHTDLGVVAPVLLASLVTTALVFVFVRKLVDPAAAWWCGLLYACQPFTVVNSTTMTNDVILACLVFASFGLFLSGDREAAGSRRVRFFVASAAVMVAAFLIKITIFPAVCALGVFSLVAAWRRSAGAWRQHVPFYATFLVGLMGVCFVYFLTTGDWWWQFKSEFLIYEVQKPDPSVGAAIDYARLMWEYPQSLFGRSGEDSFQYFEHGVLFWLFVPASVWTIARRHHSVVLFLVAAVVVIFAFFEFYPQYIAPNYIPLVRQNRYLEMLLPPAVVVVGTALYSLSVTRPLVARAMLCAVLAHFVHEASRRSHYYNDSLRDMRALAQFAASTVVPTGRPLAVDRPTKTALLFYLQETPISLETITREQLDGLSDSYVALGGARATWWPRERALDLAGERLPPHWVLSHEIVAEKRPWRSSNLRVYLVPRAAGESSVPPRPSSDWVRDMGGCGLALIEARPANTNCGE